MTEDQTNDPQAIRDFVASHPAGAIATVNHHGKPENSVVYFSVDQNLHFTFTTKSKTRKALNLEAGGAVSIALYDAASQTVLKAAGRATRIADPDEVLEAYRQTVHGAQTSGPDTVPPIARISAGEFTAYRIVPDFLSFKSYSHGDSFANAMEHANDTPHYGNPN